MIDQDKMRALAAKLRDEYEARISITSSRYRDAISKVPLQAANAIDLLLAEVEASDQKRKEAVLDAEKAREERNRVHVKLNAEWIEKTNALRAELEAAAADKRDSERYRILRRGQRWSVINWIGETLRAEQLDAAVDAALAQRQGEGS